MKRSRWTNFLETLTDMSIHSQLEKMTRNIRSYITRPIGWEVEEFMRLKLPSIWYYIPPLLKWLLIKWHFLSLWGCHKISLYRVNKDFMDENIMLEEILHTSSIHFISLSWEIGAGANQTRLFMKWFSHPSYMRRNYQR